MFSVIFEPLSVLFLRWKKWKYYREINPSKFTSSSSSGKSLNLNPDFSQNLQRLYTHRADKRILGPYIQPALRMRRAQKEMLTPVSNRRPQPSTQSEEGGCGASQGGRGLLPHSPCGSFGSLALLPRLLAKDSSPRWRPWSLPDFLDPNVDRRLWKRSIKEPKAGSSLPISCPSPNTVREQTTSSFPTWQEK